VLQGTFRGQLEGKNFEVKPGSVLYVPANAIHSGGATPDSDVVFFTVKDASHSLQGIKAS
jgi:quercetin dioxygenase-like cupin family protein